MSQCRIYVGQGALLGRVGAMQASDRGARIRRRKVGGSQSERGGE